MSTSPGVVSHRILLLGATGAAGRHLVRQALDLGEKHESLKDMKNGIAHENTKARKLGSDGHAKTMDLHMCGSGHVRGRRPSASAG